MSVGEINITNDGTFAVNDTSIATVYPNVPFVLSGPGLLYNNAGALDTTNEMIPVFDTFLNKVLLLFSDNNLFIGPSNEFDISAGATNSNLFCSTDLVIENTSASGNIDIDSVDRNEVRNSLNTVFMRVDGTGVDTDTNVTKTTIDGRLLSNESNSLIHFVFFSQSDLGIGDIFVTSPNSAIILSEVYSPVSNNSILMITVDFTYEIEAGLPSSVTTVRSDVRVNGNDTGREKDQLFLGSGDASGTRSGVIFPINVSYTNTSLANKTISVQVQIITTNPTPRLLSIRGTDHACLTIQEYRA